MILNLLLQEGVDGRVEGEYLQGGVGELQAMNVVRVVVPEEQYEAARRIIAEWEADQPVYADTEKREPRSSRGTGKFFLGIAVGAGIMYWAYSTPLTSDGVDYDGDGVLDEKWTFENQRIARYESDRNRDGRTDRIAFYDRRGIIDREQMDDNFDGTFETTLMYRRGNVVRQESDLDKDGEVDYRVDFQYGLPTTVEIWGPGRRSPRKRQQFAFNKLVSAAYDADGDGVFETQYEYDFFEEPKK